MLHAVKTNNADYSDHFKEWESHLEEKGLKCFREIRRAGFKAFQSVGFPTVDMEEWKYTNLAPLAAHPFSPSYLNHPKEPEFKEIEKHLLLGLSDCRLVFVNGKYSASASNVPEKKKFDCFALTDFNGDLSVKWLESWGKLASSEKFSLVGLNSAFFTNGYMIHVPKGMVIEKPIVVVHVIPEETQGNMITPRNYIYMEEGAQATIIEKYVSLSDDVVFVNSVTERKLETSAHLRHIRLNAESASTYHIENIQSHLARSSHLSDLSLALGGGLVRNDIQSVLDGEGAFCELNGLYLTNGEQLVDHHTLMDHAKPHCDSSELYKGVLTGKSRGVFNGKVIVRPDAQKTNAFQSNRNLILSKEAGVDTKPQLEIFADDVKCSHGATIGQLDKEAEFYLRSRGIDQKTAEQILIFAFAEEVVETLGIEILEQEVNQMMIDRLQLEQV